MSTITITTTIHSVKSDGEKVKDYSRSTSIRESISDDESIKGVAKKEQRRRKEREKNRAVGERKRDSQDRPLSSTPASQLARENARVRARFPAHIRYTRPRGPRPRTK